MSAIGRAREGARGGDVHGGRLQTVSAACLYLIAVGASARTSVAQRRGVFMIDVMKVNVPIFWILVQTLTPLFRR